MTLSVLGLRPDGSVAQPVSYPVGTRGFFPRDKVTEGWRWPLTSTKCRGQEYMELYLYPPNTPSCMCWAIYYFVYWKLMPGFMALVADEVLSSAHNISCKIIFWYLQTV